MTARARAILDRLPAHLEAARPQKRLDEVTSALALDLDTLSAALARVRRARRLLDADEKVDLLRIAALHGITQGELGVLLVRFALGRQLAQDAATEDAAAEQLIGLWGIAAPAPRLSAYSPRASVADFARQALSNDELLDRVRGRVRAIANNHAAGNGTVRALVYGAANALDLDVQDIAHSADRYLHAATVVDRLRLAFPVQQGDETVQEAFAPATERLVVEENPLTPAKTGDIGRAHAERFSVLRRGFERETLQVSVTGVEDRTIGPMLVNRDEGQGIGYAGAVPNGQTLTFTEEGRVMLDSADVTSRAYAWQGACFADGAAIRASDRVFDGPSVSGEQRAHFAQAIPTGALSASFAFPHAGDSLPMPGIGVGETRFAFFMQEGHYSRFVAGPPEEIRRIEPRPALAIADGSVFAPGASETRPTAGVVTLAWHERAAFWVNVWIPQRFVGYTPTDADGRATLDQVALAVQRFRPAGVQVEIKYLDDRWVLGRGTLPGAGAVEGPGMGTELWSAPKE